MSVLGRSQAMRLYYFVGPDYWEENLEQGRLKLADVSKLNDSFDLLTPSSKSREERKKSRRFVETIGNSFGLICMSREWSNPLMWAHYAGNHQGVCIGFDVDQSRFRKVSYVEERPTLETFGCHSFDNLRAQQLIEMGQMKFKAWEYEKEYRHFANKRNVIEEQGLYFQSFCDWLRPRRIIVGERCTADYSQVEKALGKQYTDVTIWKARSAFRSFKMVLRKNWDGA